MSEEPAFRSVAIIGLGLVGGSLARDLAARNVHVLGYDCDAATLERADQERVVVPLDDLRGATAADVVVLAVPIDEAVSLVKQLAGVLNRVRLVTDVCSTKATLERAAIEAGLASVFVGSHPMAGDHRSGWEASRSGLFTNARTYVCPTPESTPAAVSLAVALWSFVGAIPEPIGAALHDREVVWTSHLPHVASAALAAALANASIGRERLGPGGRDATRLAASDPRLWAGIALDNAEPLLPALEALERSLREIREALTKRDRSALQQQLASAQAWSRESH